MYSSVFICIYFAFSVFLVISYACSWHFQAYLLIYVFAFVPPRIYFLSPLIIYWTFFFIEEKIGHYSYRLLCNLNYADSKQVVKK